MSRRGDTNLFGIRSKREEGGGRELAGCESSNKDDSRLSTLKAG